MTRILALSDTHLEDGNISPEIRRLAMGADIILHAGDFVSLNAYESLNGLARLEAVVGNADSGELKSKLPDRKVVRIEDIRIGVVHQASSGTDLVGAKMMAREMDVHVLVFGHIHRPLIEKGERLLICPGSTTLPRMSAPSVAMIEIFDGEIKGNIIPVGSPACNYLKYAGELANKSPRK